MRLSLVYIFLVVLSTACNRNAEMESKGYYQYLNDPENGLLKSNETSQYKITLKYLPVDYLVYKDCKDIISPTTKDVDSLRNLYKENLSFLLMIEPAGVNKSLDVLKDNTSNYAEYKQKFETVNFGIADYVEVNVADTKYKPEIYTVENVYGLTSGKKIFLVFPQAGKKLKENAQCEFSFYDDIFNTGIHHFIIEQKDIDKIPTLRILG